MKLRADPVGLTIVSIIASFALAFGWWMSPFAVGFMDKPDDPTIRELAEAAYLLSHLAGTPLLVLAQVGAIVLLLFGRSRLALRVSITALGVFILLVLLACFVLSA